MDTLDNIIDYDSFLDTTFTVEVLLGAAPITVKEFLNLKEDNIVILDKMVGDGSDIYINSRIIGSGEIIVFDESLDIKIKDVSTADEAIGYFYQEGKNNGNIN